MANVNLSDSLIGKNMKAHPDCLGLYIGLDEMFIAQSAKKDGGTVLESLLRVPITEVDRTQLKPQDLNENFFVLDNWVEALGKVTARKKWKTNQVVVSLSPEFCLLRHFVIPTMIERKHWHDAIPLQARKYFHFPFEKAETAYHVYEFETAATKQKRLGVVFALTSKIIIERLQKGLKSVGLDLVTVEPAALSLSRAFNDSDKEAVGSGGRIYAFFGKDTANFVFLNEGMPVLSREVEISGSLPAERRRFETTNYTEFIAKQLEKDPFEEAVIVGYEVEQWLPALESDSKKPVRKWDLSEVYGIETKSAGEIFAIGASIKFYDTKSPDLDFVKGARLSEYEFNASLTAWKVAVVLVLVFLALIGKGWMGVRSTRAKLASAKASQSSSIRDFDGLTANQIQSNLSKIKTQNSSLSALLTDNPMTPILVEIVDSLPRDIWLTRVSMADAFPPKAGSVRQLSISGMIQTGRGGAEDMVLGRQFSEALLQKPGIQKICAKDQAEAMKYSAIAVAADQKAPKVSNRGDGRQQAAQETTFTFSCNVGTSVGGR